MPHLILASGSRYKREQLARLELPFEAINADIDESSPPEEAPADAAMRLARGKALALREAHPHAYILGGDQVVSLEGVQLHKPVEAALAREQLLALQGRVHQLDCAVALVTPRGEVFEALCSFEMEMRPLTSGEISRYVALDDVLGSAGSYAIESRGIQLFRSMRGDDYTAIIGLPLTRVRRLLEESGFLAEAAGEEV